MASLITKLLANLFTKCRPNNSFLLITLSQYSAAPANKKTLWIYPRYIWLYLINSRWQHILLETITLPRYAIKEILTTNDANNYICAIQEQIDSINTQALVYYDCANDIWYRQSITWTAIKIDGGIIFYRTNFQSTVALRFTKADFITACEAA